jgi:hypothetical protein
MRKRWTVVGAAALGLLLPGTVSGWDETGHRVVARIAWEHMTPRARAAAVALLQAAPPDAGLRQMMPSDSRPLEVRQRELFLRASAWPDKVRGNPAYHHGDWHYVNIFWEQPSPGARPRERTDLPQAGRAVEKLREFRNTVGDPSVPAAERAVQLAWLLHLAGDIHQPLHASARITPGHPEGDRGGNLFPLEGVSSNLHGWWDSGLSRNHFWARGDTEAEFIGRIAATVQARRPRASLQVQVAEADAAAWAWESLRTAQAVAYPAWLHPGEKPPARYDTLSYRAAEGRAALAGYRLAEMLNRALGS